MKKLIHKVLNRETISYLIFGVLTTLVNYVVFFGLEFALGARDEGLLYLITNFVAWIVAVIFAFFTNKLFVFESKDFSGRYLVTEFISFTGARVLTLLFESAFLFVTVEALGVDKNISKILASIFVIILNYFASKFFVFRKTDSGKKDTNGYSNSEEEQRE